MAKLSVGNNGKSEY